ncbi:hypothetical protein M0802_016949 [Mischocyttarus mexicanus]|nr:hypothetical protein M0802_016949 [Mischocyttarus mexicanus]
MKKNAHPIINHLESSDEIGQMFDRISYQKSAAVINMLENAIGNVKFISVIRNYLKKYEFSNVESKDLFELFNEENKYFVNLIDVLNRWTRLTGFPVVSVQHKDKLIKLSQQRFVVEKTQEDSESWDIPLKYTTSRREDVELVLEKPVNWIKLNHNSVGYYIVNYTKDNWIMFNNLLLTNIQVLDPINRADLLHDAFILGDNTDLSYRIVLNMTTYLRNENTVQPWIVAGLFVPSDTAESVFDKMWEFFLRETDAQEKKRLLIKLAAVKNKDILTKYLQKIQDEKVVRRQDLFEIISNIALNPMGLDIVWDFFRNHWENLIEKFPLNDHVVDVVIGTTISLFKDEQKLKEVEDFFDKYPNTRPSKHIKKNVIEDIKSNIKWLNKNLWQFEKWLNEDGIYFP